MNMNDPFAILDDLLHDLKSPIRVARSITRSTLTTVRRSEAIHADLSKIRSLCAKATVILEGGRLLTLALRKLPVTLYLDRLEAADFASQLNEAIEDTQRLYGGGQGIRCQLVDGHFDILQSFDIRVDHALLDLACRNVFENIAKCMHTSATISIGANTTKEGLFRLIVTSTGLKITPEDALNCLRPGGKMDPTRSNLRFDLWIAHQVAMAHAGKIVVIPTSPEGRTEIHLVLGMKAMVLGNEHASATD